MAVLRAFRDSTIQENNIVQTIASAAGTLSAIIFVLPGLIMVGWWTGFPYWLSVAVIGIGGILGVTALYVLYQLYLTLSAATPYWAWILFGGVRAEYTYNWVDIIPGAQRDLEDVNLMLTVGLRF